MVIYLSLFGIKTNQFNDFINDKIRDLNPRLTLKTKDIYLKLNLTDRTVKINTNNTILKIEDDIIKLSQININLDLIKFIKNKNSINNINIISAENNIKNVTNFINSYKFNISRTIIFNQINSGFIQASANILFDKEIKNDFSLEINGKVTNASLNIFNKEKINNINFDFNIKDQFYEILNSEITYKNTEYSSEQIYVEKSNNNFLIKGNVKNKKGLIEPKLFLKIFGIKQDLIKEKQKILLESDNEFSFVLKPDRSLDNLSINSYINFDKIIFKNETKNFIYLKDGNIKTKFKKKKLNILIDSKYSFINQNVINKDDKIKINIEKKNNKKIKVDANFKTENLKINIDEFSKFISSYKELFKKQDVVVDSDNKVSFLINKQNKLEKLKIYSLINIENLTINYTSKKIKNYLPNFKNKVILKNNKIQLDFSDNEVSINTNGNYSLDEEFDDYKIIFSKKLDKYFFESDLKMDKNLINIDEIGYNKKKNISSNIKIKGNYKNLDVDNKSGEFKFDDIIILDEKNKILISNLHFSSNYEVNNIDTIELSYINSDNNKNYLKLFKRNNNYELISDTFDGRLLINKLLTGDSNKSFFKIFKNLNSKIILSLEKLKIDNNSYLKKIEGYLIVKNNEIQSGKIDAILNKENKFSYILKTTSNKQKITNIFVEEPAPFIKNYKFIKGFENGNLSFNSIKKNGIVNSVIKIYDFKVKEVPLLAKVLSLASLQGIADLLTGEGIRFDEFEMQYETNKNLTTFKEIYAIGPAISILMEGYVEKNKLTSLRGTLVPATTINKTIAKIPLLGNILVGKDAGEGVFGVSFKIKGPPKNLKTTVNPVKTLTPRFITRTLEKLKKN